MADFDGKYRILRELGRGGMGTVIEVERKADRTRHAIKIIRAQTPSDLRRFEQEARAAAPLESPHVVRVTEIAKTAEGVSYIVMEALRGESLADAIERSLPLPDLLRVLCDVSSALSEAHERGIVHRDLKPDNIFLAAEGDLIVPKLLDFGVAKILSASPSDGTVNSKILGTPEYMSPEQFAGVGVDHRSDVFAMGCIVYRAVTGGRAPFPREGDMPAWAAVRAAPAVPLEFVAPEVPLGVSAAVMRALERDPSDRFESMRDFARELEPHARKEPLQARAKKRSKAGNARSAENRRWRNVFMASMGLIFLALAVVFVRRFLP